MTIREDIAKYLVKIFGIGDGQEALNPDARLVEDYGLDSAGMFELILWLEDRYEVRAEPAEMSLDHFGTIRAAEAFVERARLRANPSAQETQP
jgi:acyl carrier protein